MPNARGTTTVRGQLDTVKPEDQNPAMAKGSTGKPKKGIEVTREKGFVLHEGEVPFTLVRIINHDTNKVLWSGIEADYTALQRATKKE